jgi:hypothetical protein
MTPVRRNINGIGGTLLLAEKTGHAVLLMGDVDDFSKASNHIHRADLDAFTAPGALYRIDRFNHRTSRKRRVTE